MIAIITINIIIITVAVAVNKSINFQGFINAPIVPLRQTREERRNSPSDTKLFQVNKLYWVYTGIYHCPQHVLYWMAQATNSTTLLPYLAVSTTATAAIQIPCHRGINFKYAISVYRLESVGWALNDSCD